MHTDLPIGQSRATFSSVDVHSSQMTLAYDKLTKKRQNVNKTNHVKYAEI